MEMWSAFEKNMEALLSEAVQREVEEHHAAAVAVADESGDFYWLVVKLKFWGK